jgi:hypothetical protein
VQGLLNQLSPAAHRIYNSDELMQHRVKLPAVKLLIGNWYTFPLMEIHRYCIYCVA